MDSIERAIAILNFIAAANKPLALKEISDHLSVNKVSIFRTLTTLEKEKWVVKDISTGFYSPGIGMLQLSTRLLSNIDLRSISLPYLEELRDITHETTQLSIRVGLEQMFIESMESLLPIRLVTALGIPTPLWSGATGKSMLAFLEDPEKEIIFYNLKKSGQQVYASGNVVDIESLSNELEKIRINGYAISVGERTPNACAVAAPIFSNNRVIGSISAAVPTKI